MLTKITHASTAMQSADISLDTAVLLIDNLKKLFSQYREDGFEKAVTDAHLLANEYASTEFAQKRNRKCKTFHDEVNAGQPGHQDAQLHFKQTVFYVIVDTISSELNTRFENLGQISEKFRLILQMSEMSKEELEFRI